MKEKAFEQLSKLTKAGNIELQHQKLIKRNKLKCEEGLFNLHLFK